MQRAALDMRIPFRENLVVGLKITYTAEGRPEIACV
jgi:hypothetical protein